MCCSVRCLGLLVVLASLFAGNWYSELVPGEHWVNWVGEFDCGPDVVVERPKNLAELQAAVQRHKSVRAVATGRSFNYFVCPSSFSGAVIDVQALNKEIVVHKLPNGGHAVTVATGVVTGQLQNKLLSQGLTLRVPPGNPGYSVGAVVAVGSHNLGQAHAEDLLAVTFVLHNGTVREIKRGDPDWLAAGVSVGMLGVIYKATFEVLPYRSIHWAAEQSEVPKMDDLLVAMNDLVANRTSSETTGAGRDAVTGNKIVLYLETGVMLKEYWMAKGRTTEATALGEMPKPYINPLMFRLGRGPFSRIVQALVRFPFTVLPASFLQRMQQPAEHIFRGLHTSASLSGARKALGWQHSPESRGDMADKPTGHQYTWAGWLDEMINFMMGLRHAEVIFPLRDKEHAARCMAVLLDHRHLFWYLSSVHSADPRETFVRTDFVAPGKLMELDSGEASLTRRLHTECPGWRKHWGKAMFTTSAEERWGNPEAFMAVASRWDPHSKFRPREVPTWLSR